MTTLSEIKHYMREQKTASLFNLMTHFETSEEVMRDMLAHWIRKGKIQKVENIASKCADCKQCNPLMMEIYCWVS